MSAKVIKYNPSFLTDDELIETFVVRQASLALLLEAVRDNGGESNQHMLVIGPRGSGKTTLLRRVAAAVRRTPELDAKWFPLLFGEESYEVASAGQFWLEALHYLGVCTGDSRWTAAYDELLSEPDETRLGQRCLSRLLDFADACGKRLLLVVENLNLVLGEQIGDDDAWALRKALMHEPRLMLLGSATERFDAIDKPDKALFELFRVMELSRLTVEECRTIWNRVAGREIDLDEARAVQILTGGNPRLLTILALFGAKRSFRSLLEDLSLLVDEHTDYFKSNFESLPSAERKVFACLATLWEDSAAADVARAARMGSSQTSALLKRLEGRGAVKSVSRGKGKKRYQLAERLYNIYYLMRRGQDGGRVRAVVRFMAQFYGKTRLHEAVADIAREACALDAGQRAYHYQALQLLCASPDAKERIKAIRSAFPHDFFELPDIPEQLKRLAAPDEIVASKLAEAWLEHKLALDGKKYIDAMKALRKIIMLTQKSSKAWTILGAMFINQLKQPKKGKSCFRKALRLDQNDADAWASLGEILCNYFNKPDEGITCLRNAVRLNPNNGIFWFILGHILLIKYDRYKEGICCLQKAIEYNYENASIWAVIGSVLALKLEQIEEGVDCLRKAIKLEPDNAPVWALLGGLLINNQNKPEEGVECLKKYLTFNADDANAWNILGHTLIFKLNKSEEGVACLQRAVELNPKDAMSWDSLGITVGYRFGKFEEGVGYLRKAVEQEPEFSQSWNSLARILSYQSDHREYLVESEACARKALALEDDTTYHCTLSYILAKRGEIVESLEQAGIVLRRPDVARKDIQKITDTLAIAVALGHGRETLDLLENSPSKADLEPLAVGLRRYLGLEIKAPQEVREIGEDIVKRIDHWKKWHAERPREKQKA